MVGSSTCAHLTDRRQDARIYGVLVRDTYYNTLRLI